MRKPHTVSEWIFITIVPLLSLLNIYMVVIGSRPWISLVPSLAGIAAVAFYLKNLRFYVQLMFFWAFAQLIIVTSYSGVKIGTAFVPTALNFNWDLAQFFEIKWHLIWGGRESQLITGINFPAIFFIALAIKLKLDSVPGIVLKLKPLKESSFLNDLLPAEATVLRRMTLGDESNWYLVQINGKVPDAYLFIRPKDDFMISPKKSQVVACLKVDDPQWIFGSSKLDRKLFRTGSWAVTN